MRRLALGIMAITLTAACARVNASQPTAVRASPTAAVVAPTALPTAAYPTPEGCVKRQGWREFYFPQPDDTLESIAARVGMTPDELAAGNCITKDMPVGMLYYPLLVPHLPPMTATPTALPPPVAQCCYGTLNVAPIVSTDGTFYVVRVGTQVSFHVELEGAPPNPSRVEIHLAARERLATYQVLDTDDQPDDGISIDWTVTEGAMGGVNAVAYYADGSFISSSSIGIYAIPAPPSVQKGTVQAFKATTPDGKTELHGESVPGDWMTLHWSVSGTETVYITEPNRYTVYGPLLAEGTLNVCPSSGGNGYLLYAGGLPGQVEAATLNIWVPPSPYYPANQGKGNPCWNSLP